MSQSAASSACNGTAVSLPRESKSTQPLQSVSSCASAHGAPISHQLGCLLSPLRRAVSRADAATQKSRCNSGAQCCRKARVRVPCDAAPVTADTCSAQCIARSVSSGKSATDQL
eukprot:2069418-Pleurochrysis_carterae.AAC.2